MRKTIPIAVLLLLASALSLSKGASPAPTGDAIIAAMKRAFSPINDYRADVSLTVKGPQVSINNMSMTLYFKKPNKIHIDAKQGFAMMPNGTFLGDPLQELAAGAHATYLRTERNQGRDCYVVKLTGQGPDRTLWVDKERSVMIAAEAAGGFTTSWRYDKVDGKYYLPAEINAEMPNPRGGSEHVKAAIKFSNYRVNKGISDKIFVVEKQPSFQHKHRRFRRDPD